MGLHLVLFPPHLSTPTSLGPFFSLSRSMGLHLVLFVWTSLDPFFSILYSGDFTSYLVLLERLLTSLFWSFLSSSLFIPSSDPLGPFFYHTYLSTIHLVLFFSILSDQFSLSPFLLLSLVPQSLPNSPTLFVSVCMPVHDSEESLHIASPHILLHEPEACSSS